MIQSSVTFLPVQDIGETAAFYEKTIGLTLWKDMGCCKIFSCGEGYFGFCEYGDDRPMALGVCLSLNMENTAEVDAEYCRLRAAGIEAEAPQKHPDFPVYSFFIRDPNGYLVEFQKILAD